MAQFQVRLHQMLNKLREENHRVTPQRLAVLKILARCKDHPTVEQIYERVKPDFPMTSLATIYKNVTLFKEMGEVMELAFGDDRKHYDGNNPQPHPHLICLKCKAITDPDVSALGEISKELSRKTGYRIVTHRLDFFGICPRCQREEKTG